MTRKRTIAIGTVIGLAVILAVGVRLLLAGPDDIGTVAAVALLLAGGALLFRGSPDDSPATVHERRPPR